MASGEIVYLLLERLGAVNPPLPSGVPAPAQPPSVVARQFQCVLTDLSLRKITIQVLEAILLPGTIDSYRITLRVPEGKLMTPDASGFYLPILSLEPGDQFGTFRLPYGGFPVKP